VRCVDFVLQAGKEGAGANVLSLLQQASGSVEDKLRLLCTYYWHADSIDSGELSECIAAVQRAGGDDHALNFLVRPPPADAYGCGKTVSVGPRSTQPS
jgi:hypothetical protein